MCKTLRKTGLFVILSVFVLQGCSRDKLKLWTDFTTVFYPYPDCAEPIRIRQGHPFVVNSFTFNGMGYMMSTTPKGKIDSIIAANPYWDFIFYCNCSLRDTSTLGSILREKDCHFPVILDTADRFMTINREKAYGAIGFICGADRTVHGVAVIGTSLSFFDKSFAEVKRRLGYKQ